MNKKRKVGILLILIGIGIPLVLLFFQEDGYLGSKRYKQIERELNPKELEVLEKEIKRRRSSSSEGDLYQDYLEKELERKLEEKKD